MNSLNTREYALFAIKMLSEPLGMSWIHGIKDLFAASALWPACNGPEQAIGEPYTGLERVSYVVSLRRLASG